MDYYLVHIEGDSMSLYPSQDKAITAIQVFKKIDPTITPCVISVSSETLKRLVGTEKASQLLQSMSND